MSLDAVKSDIIIAGELEDVVKNRDEESIKTRMAYHKSLKAMAKEKYINIILLHLIIIKK